jgi:hypothetical protein
MKAIETIDDIKKYYKFKYDDSGIETPSTLNRMNFALFRIHTDPYKLGEKIEKANKIIKEGKIKDSKIIEECSKQINNMKASIDKIEKTIHDDEYTSDLLFDMEWKYDNYLGKPEALETYNKIVNSIIRENAEKLINFEKIYLIYNENFLEINKKLNIN